MKNNRVFRPRFLTDVFAAAIAAYALLVLSGCQNPVSSQDTAAAEAGTGTLLLTLSERDMGRTIMPTWPGGRNYYIDLVSVDGNNEGNGNERWDGETPFKLEQGDWELRVTAFIPGENGGEPRKVGESARYEFEVTVGYPVYKYIMLLPIAQGGGQGTFTWEIEFPGIVTSATMQITRAGDRTPVPGGLFVLVGDNATTYDSMDLGAGVYRVIFTLNGGPGKPP